MTIDEAIKHAKEKAMEQRYYGNFEKNRLMYQNCMQCAKEHEQLAEWLEELKAYKEKEFDVLKQDGQLLYKNGVIDGYNKAIDDFVKKAIEEQIQYDCPLDKHDIEKIAKQLREGDR